MWLSYHIFDPGSLDRVLSGLVLPVVRGFFRKGHIRRFFFIRYAAGGPHIRLRLFCDPDVKPQADAVLRSASNHVIESPFEPEVERYGGLELLDGSFDFFCLSSVHVLRTIDPGDGENRSRLLARALRVLLRQAVGFAAAGHEVPLIAAYATHVPGWEPCIERADREFERGREGYLRMVGEEIEYVQAVEARERIAEAMLTDAARSLDQRIRAGGDAVWQRIVSSQLHMTANRMGLLGPEEVYLGRILWRALRDTESLNPELWRSLEGAVKEPGCGCGLNGLVSAGLIQLLEDCDER